MPRQVIQQIVDAHPSKRKQKDNPLKYNKGDLVLVDCNVTGLNYGTRSVGILCEEIIIDKCR